MANGAMVQAVDAAGPNPLPAMRAGFTGEQKALIKQQVAKGCTDTELALFLHVCQSRGLDPLTKQIYAIKRGGQMTIQVGIDGARSIAARTGRFMPGREPSFIEEGKTLVSATVYAKVMAPDGSWHEISDSAYLDEYKGSTPLWSKMPKVMLSKCAEMRLLRRAFPDSFGGIYEPSEMDQAGATSPGLSGNQAGHEVASSPAVKPQDSLPKSVEANFPELAPKAQPPILSSEPASPSLEELPAADAELVAQVAGASLEELPVVEYEPGADAEMDAIMEATPSLQELAKKAEGPSPISEPQRKSIFACMREHGLRYEDLKPKINKAYGIKSMKELPADRYEEVIGRIKATGRKEAAA